MRRYLLLGGLLAALVGCQSAYKEMEPGDRVALLNDKTPPPTTPSWAQAHSTSASPLAYRAPASTQFTPGASSTSAKPGKAEMPSAVARGNPDDRSGDPGKATPHLTPLPAPHGFDTRPDNGIQQVSSTSLRPVADDKGETREPPMATAPGAPRPFPNLDGPVQPAAHEEPADKSERHASGQSGPAVKMVNGKRISLNYELKDVGPSGISAIELYVTRDGKEWVKDDKALRSGPPYIFEVDEEGMYGFTIVAKSGLGLGKSPPKPGDPPLVWVEVDLSKPEVRIEAVKHGLGVKAREVTINWTASDRNLTRRPITLLYAEKPDGPWTPIAANIENTGRYVWQSPTNGPTQFFVRVEAADLVGNIGMSQTSKPMMIDMSQPTVSILAVEPAAK